MHPRDSFRAAATTFADLVGQLPPEQYDAPGLGAWDLRALVGHTSRALITVTTYLADSAAAGKGGPEIDSPEGYLLGVAPLLSDPAQNDAIEERGREAGAALGDDPHAAVLAHLADATQALAAHLDDTVIATAAGRMRLVDYLPSRTFELVVHTLDIAHASGHPVDVPAPALRDALALATMTAAASGRGPELLRALAGRQPLAAGFSVV